MKIIVFDTEATDLTPGQICQLSYLIVEDGKVTGKNMFFAVDEMSEGAYEVHGMSMEDLEELSGGERFEVSLALALGLSRLTAGRVKVETMFLDEGFGTLDSETLDTALEALSSLRNRGKLVGVISHVAEFSEKIPCTIKVTKQGGGRSIIEGPGVKKL